MMLPTWQFIGYVACWQRTASEGEEHKPKPLEKEGGEPQAQAAEASSAEAGREEQEEQEAQEQREGKRRVEEQSSNEQGDEPCSAGGCRAAYVKSLLLSLFGPPTTSNPVVFAMDLDDEEEEAKREEEQDIIDQFLADVFGESGQKKVKKEKSEQRAGQEGHTPQREDCDGELYPWQSSEHCKQLGHSVLHDCSSTWQWITAKVWRRQGRAHRRAMAASVATLVRRRRASIHTTGNDDVDECWHIFLERAISTRQQNNEKVKSKRARHFLPRHCEHRLDLADGELYFGLSSFHSYYKDSFMDYEAKDENNLFWLDIETETT